jgi:hypothetical protein
MSDATPTFMVAGVDILRPAIQLDNGVKVLCYATVEYGVLLICGVALIQRADGQLGFWLPKASRARRLIIRGQARPQLIQAISTAYRALGGAIAETPVATASPAMEPSLEHS